VARETAFDEEVVEEPLDLDPDLVAHRSPPRVSRARRRRAE
jgi:hypothetical protein